MSLLTLKSDKNSLLFRKRGKVLHFATFLGKKKSSFNFFFVLIDKNTFTAWAVFFAQMFFWNVVDKNRKNSIYIIDKRVDLFPFQRAILFICSSQKSTLFNSIQLLRKHWTLTVFQFYFYETLWLFCRRLKSKYFGLWTFFRKIMETCRVCASSGKKEAFRT